jgi:two-component system cell cycle response regulator
MDEQMSNTLLVIDDSATLRFQVLEFLKDSDLFEIYLEAENGIDGFKALLNNDVDVVLCDLEMPGMDGQKFLGMQQSRSELRDIPVIMLTGREESKQKIKLLEHGASDYITKPFDASELLARVKVQLKIKSLQDNLKEQNHKLEELSNTDPLTQLANRRFLMQFLEREFPRSERGHHQLSLVMADIDHFKKINDTYGHQQGDLVLKAVAGTFLKELREYDLAARFGGEEFALVLPETDLKDATRVATRIREVIAAMSFEEPLQELKMTISLGVVTCPTKEVTNINDLIRIADDALYTAKREGRNRVIIAD